MHPIAISYNYQKLSALLADYGFVTMRLSDDWNGADMIAQHIDGDTFLKIQLKGRLTFCAKYERRGLYVAFRRGKIGISTRMMTCWQR